jgi:hypothetical protein
MLLLWIRIKEETSCRNRVLDTAQVSYAFCNYSICSFLVTVHSRLYIWSGREGVRRIMNSQICCNDLYFLETSPPSPPEHLQLVRATMSGVEIQWAAVPTATEYLLQIYKVPSVETEPAGKT